jgi:hypothetical protein
MLLKKQETDETDELNLGSFAIKWRYYAVSV